MKKLDERLQTLVKLGIDKFKEKDDLHSQTELNELRESSMKVKVMEEILDEEKINKLLKVCVKLGDIIKNSFEGDRVNYLETLFIIERLKLASILAHFCEEGGK